MADTPQKSDLDEKTRRIMERLVKTPPKPHDKADKAKPKEKDGKKDKPAD